MNVVIYVDHGHVIQVEYFTGSKDPIKILPYTNYTVVYLDEAQKEKEGEGEA
jgi:hypothetical protein